LIEPQILTGIARGVGNASVFTESLSL